MGKPTCQNNLDSESGSRHKAPRQNDLKSTDPFAAVPNHWPTIRAVLLVACAAMHGFAGTTATIHNRSGKTLLISQAKGQDDAAVRVTGQNDASRFHLLVAPGSGKAMEGVNLKDASSSSDQPAASSSPYVLADGGTVHLCFEEPGKNLDSELVIYSQDDEQGITFNGLITFSVRHQPGPHSGVEPEARLILVSGPTLRTRNVPCNQSLRLVSSTELDILPRSSAKPLEGKAPLAQAMP